MSDLTFTEGAQRVLDALVRETSRTNGARPLHHLLLHALMADSGRAAELLQAAGFDAERLESTEFHRAEEMSTGGNIDENVSIKGLSSDSPLTPALSPEYRGEGEAHSVAKHNLSETFSEWRQRLVRQAELCAIELSTERVTGSEHLLLAALELDESLAELLAEFRITPHRVREAIRDPDPLLDVPVETTIQIRPVQAGALDQAALFRILDASANRAREGLRVVEDYVRFQLDDEFLFTDLKEIRHLLQTTLTQLGQPAWSASRDARRDVGPRGSLASERERGSVTDVVRASLKRVTEAARSLEEYSKLIDSELAVRIERCRYRLYTVEQSIETAIHSRERLQHCRLYLLVTAAQCRHGVESLIKDAIDSGVDMIQIREKELSDRQLIEYVRRVREWTKAAGVLLIINDRPDIATATGADGVHLGQEDMDVADARKILGGRGLIGVSTHTLDQARAAVYDGADYLGVGPVFPSVTKDFERLAGLDYVREVAQRVSLPWFAIGGIDLTNLTQVLAAGAKRIAVSSAICGAGHPRGVTADFAKRLKSDEPVGVSKEKPRQTVADLE